MKKNSPIPFFVCLALTLWGFPSIAQTLSDSPYDKVGSAMQIISFAYVDSVKLSKVAEDAIVGMLKELDPHSVYISKEDLKEANEPLEGNFEGIGIQFQILSDTIVVISPISGGPSEKLGIQSGDKIVKIEGKSVAGIKIKNEDVLKQLRGKKGTKVTITILKVGTNNKLVDYTIIRDKIPIYSVDASYMVNGEIGYIKVNRFAATTGDEFRAALSKLNGLGMKDLILDLTDNGGGLMQAAIEMADEFLTDRKMIVYSQGINSPKQVNYATTRGTFEKGKLVVLVDEGSASASEIVTGAIQDWDRGLVIGRRTFGKGLVQKPFNLSDGSQIRLTIARYYTPVGRNIQKSYKDGDEAYHKDLMDRMKHGEFYSADSIHFPDSLKYFTPNHRTVYGGGGIMPDIFVPLDTTGNSEYLTNLFRKGVLSQFSLKYLDQERARLETTYPTAADFVKNFKTDQTFMDRFNAYAAKDSVSFDAKGYEISKQILQTQLKARLAQNMFGNDAMFEVINAINASFNKAVESIGNDSFEKKKISVK